MKDKYILKKPLPKAIYIIIIAIIIRLIWYLIKTYLL